MALQELHYTFRATEPQPFPLEWSHSGVVGCGDMEVMFERCMLDGEIRFKVVTPVRGFERVWEQVLGRFVNETNLADVSVEINDNNATPVVVLMRLRQALKEARKEAEG